MVAYILTPLLFSVVGFGTVYLIAQPLIHLTMNVAQLFMLTDKPDYTKKITKGATLLSDNKNSNTLNASQIKYPKVGEQFGRITAESVGLDETLTFGDEAYILAEGAGMSIRSKFPGEAGCSLIGGHNYPMFGKVYYLKNQDTFTIQTTYAKYTYEVIDTGIIPSSDNDFINQWIGKKDASYAFLYSCYPLDAIGWAANRAYVVGKVIDGPMINEHA
jgi:sortase A